MSAQRASRATLKNIFTCHCVLFVLLAAGLTCAVAQRRAQTSTPASIAVVMLSDLHFDPFHDPGKAPLLVKSSVSDWKSILELPDSSDQAMRFAAVQRTCKSKGGIDAPYSLLRGSLEAAAKQSPTAGFVTLSGDLLVHDLDCRYRAATGAPVDAADDQSLSKDFAEKTTAFVLAEVQAAFPKIPVYVALGNNDSRCNHNRLDLHDEYLKTSASAIIAGLRGVSAAERAFAQSTYGSAGYYAVTMPAPMLNTRLIVIDDIYMMPAFTSCEATEDRTGEREQIAWLQQQLDSARLQHQRVWVLGHLPPAVNPDASLSVGGSFCSGNATVRFQDTEALANQITAYAGIVTLGIFGHTHMDDLHLLSGDKGAVPVKVVASVSPVDGNLPSFTLGVVDRASSTLADYAVYKAPDTPGKGTRWSPEYDFNDAYRAQGFTPASLKDLIGRLRVDKYGSSAESRTYQARFLKGASRKKLSPAGRYTSVALITPMRKVSRRASVPDPSRSFTKIIFKSDKLTSISPDRTADQISLRLSRRVRGLSMSRSFATSSRHGWSARLELCQVEKRELDKESIWDEAGSTSLSR